MTAPTPAEVIAKLGELTPDEIARLFADEDIVGEPGAADECPVARYVHRQTGQPISVGGTGTWAIFEDAKHVYDLLPATVIEFVKRFDSGRYSHLIEEYDEEEDPNL